MALLSSSFLLVVVTGLCQAAVSSSPEDVCYYGDDYYSSIMTGVNDVTVVEQTDGSLKGTQLNGRVGRLNSIWSLFSNVGGKEVQIWVNGRMVQTQLVTTDAGTIVFDRYYYNITKYYQAK